MDYFSTYLEIIGKDKLSYYLPGDKVPMKDRSNPWIFETIAKSRAGEHDEKCHLFMNLINDGGGDYTWTRNYVHLLNKECNYKLENITVWLFTVSIGRGQGARVADLEMIHDLVSFLAPAIPGIADPESREVVHKFTDFFVKVLTGIHENALTKYVSNISEPLKQYNDKIFGDIRKFFEAIKGLGEIPEKIVAYTKSNNDVKNIILDNKGSLMSPLVAVSMGMGNI